MGKENEGGLSGFWDVQSKCDEFLAEAGHAAEEQRSTASNGVEGMGGDNLLKDPQCGVSVTQVLG